MNHLNEVEGEVISRNDDDIVNEASGEDEQDGRHGHKKARLRYPHCWNLDNNKFII